MNVTTYASEKLQMSREWTNTHMILIADGSEVDYVVARVIVFYLNMDR